ncbi:MAG: type II toxin-antitoxin system VapB family antitoxin [Nocardioides sp.]
MRTTVNIDDHLLAEAKLIAARSHRTIGSVLEDALRTFIEDRDTTSRPREPYRLPRYNMGNAGLRPGVDLYDKEQMAELLGDNDLPPGM